tara:strand:+ start:8696 stop:9322 length:627 start_codon:yes stop_codon:yes gene_type:complete
MNELKLIVFLLIPIALFGQNQAFKIDSLLSKRISELNVEKIGFTRKSCTGYGVNSTGYIIWEKDSIIKLQKIDFIEYPNEELKIYQPIELETDFFFFNFEENRTILESDKDLKHFQVKVDDEQEFGTVSTGYIQTSHSCYRNIYAKSNKFEYQKLFDYFDLFDSLKNSETEKNINYEFNNALKIIELDILINKELKRIESKAEFIIEN